MITTSSVLFATISVLFGTNVDVSHFQKGQATDVNRAFWRCLRNNEAGRLRHQNEREIVEAIKPSCKAPPRRQLLGGEN